MPWTGSGFSRHNKKATPAQARKGAKIANAILDRTGDEGKALRIANAKLAGKRPVGLLDRFGGKKR